MIGNYNDLKIGLTDSGNPFVWVTADGWSFHEQKDAIKFDAEKALSVDSFDALMENSAPTEINEPAPKKAKTKK